MSIQQLISAKADLDADDQRWLRALTREWHVIADLSFSDLVLWVPDADDNIFHAVAQIRPMTGPTALEADVIGDDIRYEPDHPVVAAYLSLEIQETSDNQLQAGIPVDVVAIPVVRHGRCIAIVERHTNQMGVRAPGALEDNFVAVADVLCDMLWRGEFPVEPPSTPSISPRVSDGVIVYDDEGLITYASPNAVSAFRHLGLLGDLEGEEIRALAQGLSIGDEIGQSFPGDLRERRVSEFDVDAGGASMRLRTIPLTFGPDRHGALMLARDTTDLRERERLLVTKDATIREIHHRVKNNLQTVAALLRLQSRRMTHPEAKAALREAMSRVTSIALVHEILSQTFDGEVAFDEIADRIMHMVGDVAATSGQVRARRVGSFGKVPAAAATSLSLVMTELCQNAVEHGLDSSSGEVVVKPSAADGVLRVDILDSGRGLPDDFDMDQTNSLGLSIVRTLVSDLDGTFAIGNRDDGHGAVATVTVPL